MSQEEVLNYLEKNKGRWITSKEIIAALDKSQGAISKSLCCLREADDVDWKNKENTNRVVYLYMYKESEA